MSKFKKNGYTYYKKQCGVCETNYVYRHGYKPIICPNENCQSNVDPNFIPKIWDKPSTEIKLFVLQDKYLSKIDNDLFQKFAIEIKKPIEDRDTSIIQEHESKMDSTIILEMWNLVYSYVGSLLKKRIKEKGFYIDKERFEEVVTHATFLWYEQFTKQFFTINESWAGQLNFKITEALYKYSNDERNDSLDKTIRDKKGNKETSLLDLVDGFNMTPVFSQRSIYDPYEDNHSLFEEIEKVFVAILKKTKMYQTKQDAKKALLSLIGFNLFLESKEKKLDQLYLEFGNSVKKDVESIALTLKVYLKEITFSVMDEDNPIKKQDN